MATGYLNISSLEVQWSEPPLSSISSLVNGLSGGRGISRGCRLYRCRILRLDRW